MRHIADEATYLQAIILSALLVGVLCLLAKQIFDSVKYVKKEFNGTETDIDQQELFKQINHHTPINGYRVFSERQNGNRYTVTFLSRNNDNCVLAEVENIADPQGAIRIITF